MSVDQFLIFFTKNLQTIIEINIIIIVVFTMFFLVLLARRGKNNDEDQFAKIEDALKKVLEQSKAPKSLEDLSANRISVKEMSSELDLPPELAERLKLDQVTGENSNHKPGGLDPETQNLSAAAAAAAGAAVSTSAQFDSFQNSSEITQLKKSIDEKNLLIEKLNSDFKELEAKSIPSNLESQSVDPDLQKKIKELEAKLAEYEIIEDDIADLSLFKQENSRLKLELEKLRSSSSNSENSSLDENLMKEFEAAVAEQKAETEEVDPLMAEFEAAVAEQKNNNSEQKNDSIKKSNEEAEEDIMKEFAAAVSGSESQVSRTISTPISNLDEAELSNTKIDVKESDLESKESTSMDDSSIDTDKMMNEVVELEKIELQDQIKSEEVLEKEIDTDKMANEASDLIQLKSQG